MNSASKRILPLNEKPSVITCIHHAYPTAIIESKELAILSVDHFNDSKWNQVTYDTSIQMEEDLIKILEEGRGDNTNTVLWRKCNTQDELILNVEYIKPRDFTRFIDVFLFHDDLEDEVKREDKTCGIRWNPWGYFIVKNMYMFNTRIYTYLKLCVKDSCFQGYASKDGTNWEYIDQKELPEKYIGQDLNIGIHMYLSGNLYRDWKNMNYIQMMYNDENIYKGIHLDYYFFPRKNYDNSYGYYQNYVDVHYDYTYDALEYFKTMHEYIHWNINHLYYPSFCLDEYYVPERAHYQKSHYNHYNLFYGYDDVKKVYHIMGYSGAGTPVVSELPYEMIDKNVITSENVQRYNYATNIVSLTKFNINSVITGLYELLHDVDSSEKVSNILTEENMHYGLSVLKILASSEKAKAIVRRDRRVCFFLQEHCKLMGERLDYLYEEKYLEKQDYESLSIQCETMTNISIILLGVVLKYMIKPNNDQKIDSLILKLYDNEKQFVENLLECLTRGRDH